MELIKSFAIWRRIWVEPRVEKGMSSNPLVPKIDLVLILGMGGF